MRQLSLKHGYSNGSTLKNALDRPWLKGERIIAEAIGVPAEVIWASRYEQRNHKNTPIDSFEVIYEKRQPKNTLLSQGTT